MKKEITIEELIEIGVNDVLDYHKAQKRIDEIDKEIEKLRDEKFSLNHRFLGISDNAAYSVLNEKIQNRLKELGFEC